MTHQRVLAVFLAALLMVAPGTAALAQQHGATAKGKAVHLVEVVIAADTPIGFETVRTGTLKARRSVKIFNQEEGRIETIAVREGDRVEKGQIIVTLDHKLKSAELAKAVANRRQAESDLKRTRELIKRKVATQERMDKAETVLAIAKAEESLIRTRLDYAQIRSPFAGVVTERMTEPGDIAPRNSHLLTIIDPNSLMTVVSVSELVIPRLRKGDPAEVKIDALGGASWAARIGRIHPTIDPRTRQGTLEVELAPVPTGAVAGQLCRVTLRAPEVHKLVIPFAALRRDRQGEYAFVVVDDVATIKRTRSGLRLGNRVEILEGLSPGDAVVVRGFLDLRADKKVSIVGPSQKEKGHEQGS